MREERSSRRSERRIDRTRRARLSASGRLVQVRLAPPNCSSSNRRTANCVALSAEGRTRHNLSILSHFCA